MERLDTAIAVVAALGAACCFAAAAVVQHGVARVTRERGLRLLLALVRQPRWLAGAALAALSFAIQGLALAFGPLALVQPLAATDVLFALPMIAVAHRYRPVRADWAGAGAVAGGIAVFLVVSPPAAGLGAPGSAAWAPVILGVAALDALSVSIAAHVPGRARVMWLAAAAGVTFGLIDALTKSLVDLLSDRGLGALLRWEPYTLVAAGLLAALLSQSSFRAGALSLSLPVIDTLEPVSAVAIAATVFGERLAASPWQLTVQLAGGGVAVAGIAVLSRSSIAAAEVRPPRAQERHRMPPGQAGGRGPGGGVPRRPAVGPRRPGRPAPGWARRAGRRMKDAAATRMRRRARRARFGQGRADARLALCQPTTSRPAGPAPR